MLYLLLILAAIFCAFQVMRSERLLLATIWLAFTSALVALLLYMLGAPEVAVIELSVGAGLVTILFVFAFSIIGEDTLDLQTIVPRLLVWVLVLAVSFFLGWLVLPVAEAAATTEQASFASMLWEQRGLDVIAQIVLIFAGVVGLLGLLAEPAPRPATPEVLSIEPEEEISPEPAIFLPESERTLEEVHS